MTAFAGVGGFKCFAIEMPVMQVAVQFVVYRLQIDVSTSCFPSVHFSCSTANNFLITLAHENGGRFHRCHTNFDAQLFAHTLLTEGFTDHEVGVSVKLHLYCLVSNLPVSLLCPAVVHIPISEFHCRYFVL